MESEVIHCLQPIIFPLRALKVLGGLPLKLTIRDGHTEVKFSCLEGIKILISILILYGCWLSLVIYDGLELLMSSSIGNSVS